MPEHSASPIDGILGKNKSFIEKAENTPAKVGNSLFVFICKLSFSQTKSQFQDLLCVISSERREHLLYLTHRKDRLRSLFAELLLRHALQALPADLSENIPTGKSSNLRIVSEEDLCRQTLTAQAPPLTFTYGPHGKPRLSEDFLQPLADRPLPHLPLTTTATSFSDAGQNASLNCARTLPCFNLSHSGDYVACVLSPHECGIDIQEHRSVRPGLYKKNLSKEEQADLECFRDEEKEARFFKYWVLKESFIKANGQGLSFPLKEAVFKLPGDPSSDPIFVSDFPSAYHAGLFQITDGYSCAAGYLIK